MSIKKKKKKRKKERKEKKAGKVDISVQYRACYVYISIKCSAFVFNSSLNFLLFTHYVNILCIFLIYIYIYIYIYICMYVYKKRTCNGYNFIVYLL